MKLPIRPEFEGMIKIGVDGISKEPSEEAKNALDEILRKFGLLDVEETERERPATEEADDAVGDAG